MNARENTARVEPAALPTMASIGCYWGWVKTNFYNPEFFPTGMSANALSFCNTGAHLIILAVLGILLWCGLRNITGPVCVGLATAVSVAGVFIVHFWSGHASYLLELVGGLMAGGGSAFLLVAWCTALSSFPEDGSRRSIVFGGILVAVTAFIIIDSLPAGQQLALSSACLIASAATVCLALRQNDARNRAFLVGSPIPTDLQKRKRMRRQMASLLLCTFLFAIPLTYLRASADNGIQVSIFATMLVLLGAIFGLDMWLRKKTGGEALSKLLVLLMSGGMLLLPFLLGRSFFFSAVLIMTGGYVFRAYIYPEFVNVAHPLGLPAPLLCIAGTLLLDAGSLLGLGLREFARYLPAEHFTNITLGIVYILFLAGFLVISYRTSSSIDRTEEGQGNQEQLKDSVVDLVGEQSHPMINGIEQQCALLAQLFGLSPREQEIAALLIRGRSIKSIAEEEVVSQNTVKTHVSHIYQKCNAHSREQLAKLAEDPEVFNTSDPQ